MALLDVSDVLLDPDFADSLQVERVKKTVGTNGLAIETSRKYPISGVVTNANGDRLKRLSIGERVDGSILVHCRFVMNEGDVITWKGRRYTVTSVDDYSNFGRGFVAATCELIPLAG
jgi:galactose-6-phosphate isomerase